MICVFIGFLDFKSETYAHVSYNFGCAEYMFRKYEISKRIYKTGVYMF